MLGGGTYAARWGYSCDFGAVENKIVSCENCLDKLLKKTVIGNCTKCTNWEIVDHNSNILQYKPPVDYPKDSLYLNGDNKLYHIKLTYKKLKEEVTCVQEKFENDDWDKKTTESYLRTLCINKESIVSLINHAEKKKTKNVLTLNKEKYSQEYCEVQTQLNENPSDYEDWIVPSSWRRNMELEDHVDVIMHLVFLGIVKKVTMKIHKWGECRHQFSPLISYMTKICDSFLHLNLSWIHIIKYTGRKMGGWVSENYIGLSRIFKWEYSFIDQIAPDVEYILPITHYKTWTGKQCEEWLVAHGLEKSGSVLDKKNRVTHYMKLPDGPPKLIGPKGGSVLNVINVSKAMHYMVSFIMSDSITKTVSNEIERHIKIFLTIFNKFDCCIKRNDKKSTWIASYNFVCLLNIPQVVHQYGPVYNYWEGGGLGENYIQVAKKIIFITFMVIGNPI